jgi:hypothetical protein
MSRRSRRTQRSQRNRSSAAPIPSTPEPAAQTAVEPSADAPAAVNLDEYRYVITDLRRVAILAVAMFTLLIVLSFFVR